MIQERCANDNHRRAVVTVRFCPNCGMVVNANILVRGCLEEKHARMRRTRSIFCMDCGERIGQARWDR